MQREAVRAILNIGTDAAYRILEQALTSGTPQSRDAIMQSIGLVRDERATPLFAYILGHVDHRGALGAGLPARHRIARRAARSRRASRRCATRSTKGEWWAPRRTAALRHAAAAGAGAHRHAGRHCRARGGDRRRLARRPRRGAPHRACAAPARAGVRRSDDAAASAAGRRAPAPLRRVAALGAALFAGPSDHRAQPRVAVDARCSCCTACSRRSSSAWSATK